MRYYKKKIFVVFILSSSLMTALAQNPSELYKLSVEQMNKGDYPIAMNYINRAMQEDSTKNDYVLQKAMLCYHLHKYEEAIRYCYTIQKTEPDNPRVLLLRGLIGLTTKSYGGAIFLFGKVIKSSGDKDCRCKAYLYRGKVFLETDKVNEAFADFNAANALQPDSLDILMAFAEAYVKVNQPDEAITKVLKITSRHPAYANAYKMLGNIYYHKKENEKALEAFHKFCELNPNDEGVFQTISNIYLDNKNFDQAHVSIGRASQLDPSDPFNYKILAYIYFAKGQKDEGCNSVFRAFELGYLERYGYDLLDVYLKNCEGK
jgi:tetratricopeptide (TPR) repeat protein